ncbi:MAG: DUF2935 domain-containing protein [Desulfitobacteriaceae bacterium]|nr:DUF2935 domain-containing protein [Desulfitobacteriaceae bacterium]MDD4754103.1 DUF2935 domain-containing protein [Desulfitobacteriaceae bacterium]
MLSNFEFVRQSLELNLFFLRIMKEHAFFIEGGFTPANPELAACADEFKKEFARLLSGAVNLSQGVISPQVAASGEIVTGFTLKAEEATECFTAIPINTNITRKELALVRCGDSVKASLLADDVCELNNRIIKALRDFIDFKGRLLQKILSCKIFTFNYPLLIDHLRREAILFLDMLCRLQRRVETDIVREAIEQETFWNRIMAEHSEFIRGLLDPTEEMLIKTADKFADEFDELTAEALAIHKRVSCLPEVTEDSLVATKQLRDFKAQGTQGILNCEIRSIILPLLGDHVLREANHFLRLLKIFHKEIED